MPNIGKILRDLHPVLRSSERCRDIVKELPVLGFIRPQNLKDFLVSIEQDLVGKNQLMIEALLDMITDDVRFVKPLLLWEVRF